MIKKKTGFVSSDGSLIIFSDNLINKKIINIKIKKKDEINFFLNLKIPKRIINSKDSLAFKQTYLK